MTGILLYDLGTLIYCLGAISLAVFTFHYGLTAPFERDRIGILFVFIGVAGIAGAATLLTQIFTGTGPADPNDIGRFIYRLVGYSVQATIQIALLGVYLYERHLGKLERKAMQ